MKFKKVSADEARAARKQFVRDLQSGTALAKAFRAPPSWDKDQRSARFIMSTEQQDRYGDIIVTDGIDTTEFERNPVGLLFHNSRTWPVAKWANLEKVLKGRPKRLEGDFILLPNDAPGNLGDTIAETEWMIANGGISANSIGFIPDWNEIEFILDEEEHWTGGLRFNICELVECSVCAIPANPGALVKGADGHGALATELIEDVLDNWARTPAGLIVPRAEFEAAHKEMTGDKTTIVMPVIKDVPDGTKFPATTTEEATALVGMEVALAAGDGYKPAGFAADARGVIMQSEVDAEGKNLLIVSYKVGDFPHFVGNVEAKNFVLAPKAAPKVEAAPAEQPKPAEEVRAATGEIVVTLDTADAEAGLGRLGALVDSISEKFSKLFSAKRAPSTEERIEPHFDEPVMAAPEAVVAAQSLAEQALARIRANGLIT